MCHTTYDKQNNNTKDCIIKLCQMVHYIINGYKNMYLPSPTSFHSGLTIFELQISNLCYLA